MIKQPLNEYLEKICEYKPNGKGDPCRYYWRRITTYDSKYELIKYECRSYYINYNGFNNITRILFQRYMNNTTWKW